MPVTFKLSTRLALLKASFVTGAALALACIHSDVSGPRASPRPVEALVTSLPAITVVASGYQSPNVPQNTLDNNLATYWSANGDGQWIRYDLGALTAVSRVDIAWYQGNQWAYAFDIAVSPDTVTWTTVFSRHSSGQTLQPETYLFPTVSARYVRIVGHGQWSGTKLHSRWTSITEVHVYGATVLDPADISLSVAAVTASGFQSPNTPQNTLDGSLSTRWSAQGDGQWIRYDLGTVAAIDRVDIAWYDGTQWASAFAVQVSLDSVT